MPRLLRISVSSESKISSPMFDLGGLDPSFLLSRAMTLFSF